MKTDKLYAACLAGMVLSVILFCLTASLQIKNGYASDAGIYVSGTLTMGLWILLAACPICLAMFCILIKMHSKRGIYTIANCLLAALLLSGLLLHIGWHISFNNAQHSGFAHGNLQSITLCTF